MNVRTSPLLAFTLVEMVVVLAIISILIGISFALPRNMDRGIQVRAAADELASVLRETRARAMRANRTYAVTFNIENAPGSSGAVLNNRSGGHWYRVLGPSDTTLAGRIGNLGYYGMAGGSLNQIWGRPPFFFPMVSYLNGFEIGGYDYSPMRYYLDMVNRSWAEEPHKLAPGKVRFLALTDQDNGDNVLPGMGGYYSHTYPRPWFGYWEAGTGALRTWGGYDPTLKAAGQFVYQYVFLNSQGISINGRLMSHSGFYYEGYDGDCTGCVNPSDRLVVDDQGVNHTTGAYTSNGVPGILDIYDFQNPQFYTLLKKGDPRPLINGNWLDFAILFFPDGSVSTDWFRLRNAYASNLKRLVAGYGKPDPYPVTWPPFTTASTYANANDGYNMLPWGALAAGVPDRTGGFMNSPNIADDHSQWPTSSPAQREATDYVNRTGFYWITLAPDAADDTSTYPSAAAALETLKPMYRVGISPEGLVKVLPVATTYINGHTAADFDTAITGANWENRNSIWGQVGNSIYGYKTPVTQPNYMNHQLWNADGSPRGSPVFDMVVSDMMQQRMWWWK